MSLRFQGVVEGPLWLDQHFEIGITALVGHPGDGLERLLELATGCARPARGVVSLNGTPIFNSPPTRAAIGSSLGDEWSPPGRLTLDWIRELLRLHRVPDGVDPAECLERLGLGALAQRITDTLSARERRAVTLGVALSLPAPRALVLEDPLGLGVPNRSRLIQLLGEASRHTIVLLTTPHPEDATLLGAGSFVFAKGRCLPAPAHPSACFRVTTDRPGPLSAHLLSDPRVSRVHAPAHARTLEVSGHDVAAVSRAILEASVATEATLENLIEASLDLDALQAAWRGHADGAYTAAYQTASQVNPTAWPAAVPTPPAALPAPAPPAATPAISNEPGGTNGG